MSWTDGSNTLGNAWSAEWPSASSQTDLSARVDRTAAAVVVDDTILIPNALAESYFFQGASGYEPLGVPNPIENNIDQNTGGGGSTRPSTGMIYPRGQG